MAREHKTTPQYPIIALPLEDTDIVEVWRDGKQYHAPFATLGGVPDAHAPSHGLNGPDPIGTDTPDPNAIPVSDGQGTLDSWISDASTTKKGKVQLADSLESAAGKAMQSNDPRGSNARTPTAHVASHLTGSDQIPDATTSARGLMGNGDKSKLESIDTALIPSNDEKAALGVLSPVVGALAGSYGTPSATNKYVTESDPVLSIGGGGGTTGPDLLGIGEMGPGLSVSEGGPALAALNSTDVAFIGNSNRELRTYRFNGTTWSQEGTGLSVNNVNDLALAALNSTDVAFIDAGNRELRTYRFNGASWSQIGTGLSVSGVVSPALAALNSTDVAFIDSINKELRTYRFNGTSWSQVGDGLSVSGTNVPALAALNSTDVALIDYINDELRTYRFNGASWSQVGTGLSVSGTGIPALTSLNSTDVAFIDSVNEELRVYRFNGTAWSQVGTGLSIDASTPALAALNSTDVAFKGATNDKLRTYSFLFGYDSASVNIAADYEVPEIATGKSIVIRRASAYDGNPVTITPPSGATFEGLASLSLYGQYSFVELERINSTVFAIKNIEDQYTTATGTVSIRGNILEQWGRAGPFAVGENNFILPVAYLTFASYTLSGTVIPLGLSASFEGWGSTYTMIIIRSIHASNEYLWHTVGTWR